MGAELSTEQADETSTKTAQTALARRRGSALDHVHALLSAAIEAGTQRLDNIGKAVGHVNARITPIVAAQLDLDARQGRMEEHLSKLDERLDALFEQARVRHAARARLQPQPGCQVRRWPCGGRLLRDRSIVPVQGGRVRRTWPLQAHDALR